MDILIHQINRLYISFIVQFNKSEYDVIIFCKNNDIYTNYKNFKHDKIVKKTEKASPNGNNYNC